MIREGHVVPPRPLARAIRLGLLAGGVGGTLVLAGCMDQGGRFVSADETAIGDVVRGELMSESGINLKDGSRQGRHWLCSSSDDGTGTIYQLDAPFLGQLSLFDGEGNWLGEASSSLGSDASLLLSGSGECYLVVVSGSNRKDFGPYALKPQSAPEADTLANGVTVAGVAGSDDARYAFTVEEASRVALRLSGGAASLTLNGAGTVSRPLLCGDDRQVLTAYLEPGDYEAVVAAGDGPNLSEDASCNDSFASAGNGYRLSMELSGLSSGERNGGPLRDGDHITGTLAEAGATNSYTLDIAEPTQVRLGVLSTDFDAVMAIRGGQTDIQIDDTGDDTNPTFDQLLMPGRYRVIVSGYESEHGAYSVEMMTAAFDGEFRNSGELAGGESVHGMADGTGPYVYSLALEQPADVTISAFSSAFDTLLTLDGPGVSISDDDGAGDTNSRITTMLPPGDYRVEVASYGDAANGAFRVDTVVAPYEGEVTRGCDSAQGAPCDIQPGTTVLGELRDGSQQYQLVLEGPSDVVIAMSSTAFDTLLGLEGQGVEISDDDGGGDTNSRIATRLEAGTYQITADTYDGTGAYILQVEAAPLP